MKEKQKKTRSMPRQIRWDKLDNTAHLFPSIAGENSKRISAAGARYGVAEV